MFVEERDLDLPLAPGHRGLISHVEEAIKFRLTGDSTVTRFFVAGTEENRYRCGVGLLGGLDEIGLESPDSVFRFVPRKVQPADSFNAVLVVPTGIGAEIGGHAGDATVVARVLASICDTLVTHPNVVNASDINELTDNTLYVEGSVLTRLLMGTVGLSSVRSNRVLVIVDAHEDELFVDAAVNAVSAARSSYGLHCPEVIKLDPPVEMKARHTDTGRATGHIETMAHLCQVLKSRRDDFDAVAISSVIKVPLSFHREYYDMRGEMVNPWGNVEALLTHAISGVFNVPSAHSPMFESREIANLDVGIVDPRMAAEVISVAFLQSVLKGLHRSPRIVVEEEALRAPGVFTAADVSCLVIPDGCLGLPVMAALEQGIPVITVRENKNLMRNDLSALPWRQGQLIPVENYWEAAGVMSALKAGIAPESVRRPLAQTKLVLERAAEMPATTQENRRTG